MRRNLLIIAIAILVISIPAVIAVLVVDRTPALQNGVLRLTNRTTVNANTSLNANVVTTNTASNPDRASIMYVARNFSESYGSGTNQNNAAHLEQAKRWATADFMRFIDRQIIQERAVATTPFHGVISEALVISVTRQTATIASATVALQRQETIDAATKTFNQELFLDFLKQGTAWKVNAATWQAL